jgi:hypothetical protein
MSDPFASTAQALGRARERRSNRGSAYGGGTGSASSSLSSSTQGGGGQGGGTPTTNTTVGSSSTSSAKSGTSSLDFRSSNSRKNDRLLANNSSVDVDAFMPSDAFETNFGGPNNNSSAAAADTPSSRRAARSSNLALQRFSTTNNVNTKINDWAQGGGGGSSNIAAFRGGSTNERNVFETLPPAYQFNPKAADPVLFYLPRLLQQQQQQNAGGSSTHRNLSLDQLLTAAEDDVRLHRARIQASLEQGERFFLMLC